MQVVKKSALIFLLIWLGVLIFMPKTELYYTLEKKLAKQEIKLNEKSIEEGLFSLRIKDLTIYVQGIALAKVEEVEFFTVLFYSSLTVKNLEVDEVLHAKVPAATTEAKIRQYILNPLMVSIDANGSSGRVVGEASMADAKLHLDFVEEQKIGTIKSSLTKGKKGWFYEKSF